MIPADALRQVNQDFADFFTMRPDTETCGGGNIMLFHVFRVNVCVEGVLLSRILVNVTFA